MSGKSGIGSYFDALLPYFIKDFECLLIGSGSVIEKYKSCAGVTVCECTAEPFSEKRPEKNKRMRRILHAVLQYSGRHTRSGVHNNPRYCFS